MRKTIVSGTVALLILGLGASASAIAALPSQVDVSKVSVSFADLNIENAAGARVLYSRLQQASETVCSFKSYRELGSLSRVAATEQCYVETLNEAVSKIDSAALRKIHSS